MLNPIPIRLIFLAPRYLRSGMAKIGHFQYKFYQIGISAMLMSLKTSRTKTNDIKQLSNGKKTSFLAKINNFRTKKGQKWFKNLFDRIFTE